MDKNMGPNVTQNDMLIEILKQLKKENQLWLSNKIVRIESRIHWFDGFEDEQKNLPKIYLQELKWIHKHLKFCKIKIIEVTYFEPTTAPNTLPYLDWNDFVVINYENNEFVMIPEHEFLFDANDNFLNVVYKNKIKIKPNFIINDLDKKSFISFGLDENVDFEGTNLTITFHIDYYYVAYDNEWYI